MKRWHEEASIYFKKKKRRPDMINNGLSLGYYRKAPGLICTKSRCSQCKAHKFPIRVLTTKENLARADFRIALKELNNRDPR